jgi:hypothetical protein
VLLDHFHPILGSAVDTWATVFVAVGTVGAVAYALFRDLVVVPRRRPKLDLRFGRTGNDQVVVGTAAGFDAAYIRLRVANGAGKDAADDVVVMVTEVRRLEDSENPLAEARPIMLPLAWSGSSPPLTVGPVHPGSERHVDLVHVDWPARDEVDIARKWRDNAPRRLRDLRRGSRPQCRRHPLRRPPLLGRQVVRQGGDVGSPPRRATAEGSVSGPGPWEIGANLGRPERPGVDARGWLWTITRGAQAVEVVIEISGTARSGDPLRLPEDTRQALETDGRAELLKVLDQDNPPSVIRCGSSGCSYLYADEVGTRAEPNVNT